MINGPSHMPRCLASLRMQWLWQPVTRSQKHFGPGFIRWHRVGGGRVFHVSPRSPSPCTCPGFCFPLCRTGVVETQLWGAGGH